MLKPSSFNRGRGVHVFSTLKQLYSLINEYIDSNRPIPYKTELALTRAITQPEGAKRPVKRNDLGENDKFSKSREAMRKGSSLLVETASGSKEEELGNG
jgi:hypothetical protein